MDTTVIRTQGLTLPKPPACSSCREERQVEEEPRAKHAPHGRRAEGDRPGRAHLQQGLKHLLRDVRHDIKDELRDLEEAGNLDPEYAAAVQDLVHDFSKDLKDVFHQARGGQAYDRDAVVAGIGQAMADLTAGLAALREQGTEPVIDPAPAPEVKDPVDLLPEEDPGVAIDAPEPGLLLDARA
ncbi:MAG: hypothetical protein AB7V45_12115 [Candidatus Krumholzibacteriia bacterium]